ncbi:MAG: cytochrome c oxidase subunit II [Halobacteriales archaeon]|nr:cytochrome c oxidase subunit II [Halobacteriales archaeon]
MYGVIARVWLAPLQAGGLIPTGSRVEVFRTIYLAFLVLGTLVGVVVIGYMLWKAYAYRTGSERSAKADVERPVLGEIPTGGGGGRKLALSFGLSTVIVVSLIIWTYGTLLYVENSQAADAEAQLEVEVVGKQFAWEFHYENGYVADSSQGDAFRVPVDRRVRLTVTSEDVMHNFGITALRVKSDAIPGQTTSTWFLAEEVDTHQADCFELCGAGHSYMSAEVVVMPQDEFDDWYASVGNESEA